MNYRQIRVVMRTKRNLPDERRRATDLPWPMLDRRGERMLIGFGA